MLSLRHTNNKKTYSVEPTGHEYCTSSNDSKIKKWNIPKVLKKYIYSAFNRLPFVKESLPQPHSSIQSRLEYDVLSRCLNLNLTSYTDTKHTIVIYRYEILSSNSLCSIDFPQFSWLNSFSFLFLFFYDLFHVFHLRFCSIFYDAFRWIIVPPPIVLFLSTVIPYQSSHFSFQHFSKFVIFIVSLTFNIF